MKAKCTEKTDPSIPGYPFDSSICVNPRSLCAKNRFKKKVTCNQSTGQWKKVSVPIHAGLAQLRFIAATSSLSITLPSSVHKHPRQ